jgi:O-acetylhomoserine (thiol)-lyase
MTTERQPGLGTLCLHAGQEPDASTNARCVPIYATTSFTFDNTEHAANLFALKEFGNIYSRIMNPTCDVLEKRMAALDGGVAALAMASGQAAITNAILTITSSGQNIVSSTSLYGGTWTLFTQTFKRLGIEVKFFDPARPEQISELVDADTRCVYIESSGNPKNDVPDFARRSANVAHAKAVPVICDNTVMTPALLRPFDHGIDIAVYSCTKFLGGHGTHVGGCIVDSGKFDWAAGGDKWPEFNAPDPAYHGDGLRRGAQADRQHRLHHQVPHPPPARYVGAMMSPFAAFLFLQGIETLHLRMPRHCEQRPDAWRKHLKEHAGGRVGQLPRPARPCRSRQRPASTCRTAAARSSGFGIKGGAAAGRKRFIEAFRADVAPGQHRRRQDPLHPPGEHHALAAHLGRAS